MQLPLLLPKETVRPVPVLNTTYMENTNGTFPLANIYQPANTTAYSQHQIFSTSNVYADKNSTSTPNPPIHAITIPVLNNTSYKTQEPIRSEIFPPNYGLPQPVINLPLCTYVEESKMLKPVVKIEPTEIVGNWAHPVNTTQRESYLKEFKGFAQRSERSTPELECLQFFSHKLNDKVTDSNTLFNSKYHSASELITLEPSEYNSNTAQKRSKQSPHVDKTQKKRKVKVEICESRIVEKNKMTDTSVNYVDIQHTGANETNSYKGHVERASKGIYQNNNQEGTKAIESDRDHTSRVPNDPDQLPHTGADLSGVGNDKFNGSYTVRSNIKSDRTSQSLCDIDVSRKKCYILSIDEQEKHSIAKNPAEKFTTLSNIKLNSVKDHHLLNTPISHHEASKLICSDRVDPYFKQELTSRVQHKQVIGVGSSKQPDPTNKQANTVHYDGSGEMNLKSIGEDGNAIQLIRPRKEHTNQMSDAKNSSKPSLNSVSSIGKLEEISKNNQHNIATPIDSVEVKFKTTDSDVKTIHLVRPRKERDTKNMDAKTNADTENSPKQSMTPVIRINKLEGISKDSVVSIIPTDDKRNESSFNIYNSSGLSKLNSGNSKKLFYIISSGKNSKSQLNSTQIEITKKSDMHQVLDTSVEKTNTNKNELEKTFISKSISPKSFKLNGLIVASPKPITQEIYKQLQVNANIVRSLKAPVCTETNICESVLKSKFAHVDNNKVISQVKEINNRTEMPRNQLYNSKLTVAQLLKNKRGEEQLELMLKSKLNTSSNALNDLNNTCQQGTFEDSSASISLDRPDKNPKSMIIDDKTRFPEHSCQSNKQGAHLSKSSNTQIPTSNASVENIKSQYVNQVNSTVSTVTKGETIHKTARTFGDLTHDSKQDTFSVRLGGKMVVMRKPQTPPEKIQNSRKKLPAPKSRKQYELSVKHETLNRLKNKLKSNSLTPKDSLIEKLQLIPTSKLIKKLKIIKQNELHQYSFKIQSALPHKTETQREVPSSTAEASVPSGENYFRDTLVPIVQIWKGGKGNFKHKLQVAKLKHLNSNDAKFHRWHEYSDYPCVIHSTQDETIRKIDIESYKQGFYLLTRTDNSLNRVCSENEYKMPAILSLYPSDLSLLPFSSRAIVIGTELNGENEEDAILSKFEKCNNDLEGLIRVLLQIPDNDHWKKDSRYSSVIDETMSPRACAPMFYSTNMHEYFSDMNHEELNKSRDKECTRSTEKRPAKTKYLTKLPSCSSKAAALKKKQNALLKTCLKIKKARHLNCVDKNDNSEAALSVDVAKEKSETKGDLEKNSVNDGVSYVEDTIRSCNNVNDFEKNQGDEDTLTVD